MKVIVKEKESGADIKYPCLMITDRENIVLFSGPSTGVVINTRAASSWSIGEYCNSWADGDFRPFNGTIELSNED